MVGTRVDVKILHDSGAITRGVKQVNGNIYLKEFIRPTSNRKSHTIKEDAIVLRLLNWKYKKNANHP